MFIIYVHDPFLVCMYDYVICAYHINVLNIHVCMCSCMYSMFIMCIHAHIHTYRCTSRRCSAPSVIHPTLTKQATTTLLYMHIHTYIQYIHTGVR
jgi:hypothetical protein